MNFRHSLLSVAGVVSSQAANFLAVVLIGKFCGPDELGHFSYLTAIGLFLGSVVGLRLETACMAAEKRPAAAAVVSSSVVAVAICVALAAAARLSGHSQYLAAVALAAGVFIQQALSLALTTERKFGWIAIAKAAPNALFVAFLLAWMLAPQGGCERIVVFDTYGAIFLVATVVPLLAYLAGALPLIRGERPTLSRSQLDYARYALPITVLNSVVIYATSIIMPLAFGPDDAGIYALSYRIGYFAASLLSQSLGALFRRDMIDFAARGDGARRRNPAISFALMLAVISTVLVVVCYVGLTLMIDLQMGEVWSRSKRVYLILIPYFILMAIFGSVAQVFIVLNRQKIDLTLQAANAMLILVVFGAVSLFGLDFMHAVALLSLAGAAVAGVGIYSAIRVAGKIG